jgi:hypothetical protein
MQQSAIFCSVFAECLGGQVRSDRLDAFGISAQTHKCPCPPRVLGGTGLVVCVRRCPTFPPWWVVSSALAGLASGFGMGPGVSLSLWPP